MGQNTIHNIKVSECHCFRQTSVLLSLFEPLYSSADCLLKVLNIYTLPPNPHNPLKILSSTISMEHYVNKSGGGPVKCEKLTLHLALTWNASFHNNKASHIIAFNAKAECVVLSQQYFQHYSLAQFNIAGFQM